MITYMINDFPGCCDHCDHGVHDMCGVIVYQSHQMPVKVLTSVGSWLDWQSLADSQPSYKFSMVNIQSFCCFVVGYGPQLLSLR